jgi:hypothetical protein
MKDALLAKCADLPAELTSVLLSKFSINGAIPVTMDDLKAVLKEAVAQMRTELRDALPSSAPSTSVPPSLIDPNLDPRFHLWSWGNKMHMVPQDWLLPSIDTKAMWNLWHFGHVGSHIRPLRYLHETDLVDEKQCGLLSKVRGVMALIAEIMVEMGIVQSVEAVEKLSSGDSAEAFDRAVVRMMELAKAGSTLGKRRWTEMVVASMYAVVGPLRKKRAEEKKERKRRQQEEAGR